MTAPTDHAPLRDGRYTVVYEGDPAGARILNGEPAPGRAITVSAGDAVEERAALLAAQQAVEAERDELKAALKPFAELLSDREQHAHEALQVGGYVPLDHGFEVEVPLVLLYTARAVFLGASTHKGQPHE